MKKEMKFIGLLVLAWVLLASTTVSATIVNITPGNLGDYDYLVDSGTVDFTDSTSAPDTASEWSLELVWPLDSDDAGIQITDLGDPTIDEIESWSYWVNAAEYYNPHLTMFLDTNDSGNWDTEARVGTYNVGSNNEWLDINSSGTISFWIEPEYEGGHSKSWTWLGFQTEFGDATVEKIRISHYGYYVGDSGVTAYLDDFSFNDITYSIVPEPATIALLGLGSIFLLRRRR